MRLFLYRTLLNPAMLAAASGDETLPAKCRAAMLRGWTRVRLARTPYPTLKRSAGDWVVGKVVAVDPRVSRRLSAYEGREYRLRPVSVMPGGAAWAWIAPGGTSETWTETEVEFA